LHSRRRLLRSESQTAIPGSARIGMRIILWHRSRFDNESYCVAALSSACHGTLPIPGVAARASCPYGSGRLADLFQCSSVRTIGVYPSFTMIVASD
jgi:hypothetical protein